MYLDPQHCFLICNKICVYPLLGDGLEVPLRLLLLDSTGALGLTIGAALGHGALAPTTPHADAVDDKA